MPDIAVVGFGFIGSVVGAVLAERGCNVTGVEVDSEIRQAIEEGHCPFAEPEMNEIIERVVHNSRLSITDDVKAVAKADVVLVCVGTPLGQNQAADLSAVEGALAAISPHLRPGQLVILKSTLPPGTTSELAKMLRQYEPRVLVAFCPERLAEGQAVRDLTSIPVVVGGVDAPSTEAAAAFFEKTLPVEVIKVRNATTAEMSKLADNLWIDLNIALANEIAKISDRLNIDALEVIDAANSLPKLKGRVNILLPSLGVGGYCLTKDPWFVHEMGRRLGLDLQTPVTSRRVNDTMPSYSVSLIRDFLCKTGVRLEDAKIAVLGLAFKSNTGDCRYTPTAPAIKELREAGCELRVFDPWVKRADALKIAGIAPVASIDAAISGVHVVAFFTGHREFHLIEPAYLAEKARPGALIFDGRMYFNRGKIEQMIARGLTYKGVGW